MSQTEQAKLTEYDQRAEDFARVRALIMKIVNSQPGLTVEEISKEFMVRIHESDSVDGISFREPRTEKHLMKRILLKNQTKLLEVKQNGGV
jgi:hypothetical protein